MKSLIEEASTIGKAIEKAWERAGQPQSFSVKVCENPEYGFLGMTKKYGKVVIFFDDFSDQEHHKKKTDNFSSDAKKFKPSKQEKKGEKEIPRLHEKNKKQQVHTLNKDEVVHVQPVAAKMPKEKVASTLQNELPKENPTKKQAHEYIWTEPMVEHVDGIITKTISLLDRPDISFNLKNEQHNLKIIFNGLLVHEPTKEYAFYKHFAHLLITALRTKFKTEFKHLRLVLSRE